MKDNRKPLKNQEQKHQQGHQPQLQQQQKTQQAQPPKKDRKQQVFHDQERIETRMTD